MSEIAHAIQSTQVYRPTAEGTRFTPQNELGSQASGSAKPLGSKGDSDDQASFSPEARALAEQSESGKESKNATDATASDSKADKSKDEGEDHLTEGERQEVEKLKSRDKEVRIHEQAHVRAAGAHFNGGPYYDYQSGPDGKRYAVGGHVNIDVSPIEGDPLATIAKADQVRRAALAPAEPSGKDRQVASSANALKAKARQELQEEARLESTESTDRVAEAATKESDSKSSESSESITASASQNRGPEDRPSSLRELPELPKPDSESKANREPRLDQVSPSSRNSAPAPSSASLKTANGLAGYGSIGAHGPGGASLFELIA